MSAHFTAPDAGKAYRHIYLLESRRWWPACQAAFDPAQDLLLTYDFGLRRQVQLLGGTALYVDYLVDPQRMQRNNFLTYDFFRTWHLDAHGRDIFTHRQIPFGFSFRIDIWNDLIFGVRTRACLAELRRLRYQRLFAGTSAGLVEAALGELAIDFTAVAAEASPARPAYFFPIHQWMDEKVRSRKLRHQLKPLVARIMGRGRLWLRTVAPLGRRCKPTVFVQEYYPTRRILQRLQRDTRLDVLLAQYSWAPGLGKLLRECPIPVWGSPQRFVGAAEQLLREFRQARQARLVLEDGLDVTDAVVATIEQRVAQELPESLRTLECILRFLDRQPVKLEVMISNLGRVQALVHSVCESRNVPSYLIINGLLGHAYLDEGKYADTINAYSANIKRTYFRNADNVVTLGDPRMDDYAQPARRARPGPGPLTVTIGASGFNITNLGSYVAVEFEFLHDVLLALQTVRQRGAQLKILIKVRDNGYRQQYEAFTAEYFPGLVSEILHGTPIRQVLEQTDFYVSIYSQTLMEAACLGIPCVYYKKDTEEIFPPFDSASELVTASSVAEMVRAYEDFVAEHPRFEEFLRRETLEKYVGPLDGGNLRRNLQQIYALLQIEPPREVH